MLIKGDSRAARQATQAYMKDSEKIERDFVMNKWDKILYAGFFFMIAVVSGLLGSYAEFPKVELCHSVVILVLCILNKDKIKKNLRKYPTHFEYSTSF